MIATICYRIEAAPEVVEHPRGLTRSLDYNKEGLAMKPTRKQDDPTPRPTAEARFLAKVVEVPSGCWLWTASRDGDGYGLFHRPTGATIRAHIWAYEHYVGPVPVGLQLDHLCRKRSCVNPAHLEPVTQRENVLRGEGVTARNAAKTHCKRGHKFTPESTYIQRNGSRYCRTCRQIHRVNYENRKRTA